MVLHWFLGCVEKVPLHLHCFLLRARACVCVCGLPLIFVPPHSLLPFAATITPKPTVDPSEERVVVTFEVELTNMAFDSFDVAAESHFIDVLARRLAKHDVTAGDISISITDGMCFADSGSRFVTTRVTLPSLPTYCHP